MHIDESLFRHKPKVLNIHFFCRPTTQEVWVFGLVDTSQTPSFGYVEIVQRRDAATLLPIINAHTAQGNVVSLPESTATTPNISSPSRHFVDPTTGVHTQNIESYWNRVKTKLKRMKGCHAHQLPSYLDEFMWRERNGLTYRDALSNIMRDIARWFEAFT